MVEVVANMYLSRFGETDCYRTKSLVKSASWILNGVRDIRSDHSTSEDGTRIAIGLFDETKRYKGNP